jgi:xanthine dehydrogenase YagS FAD-binding subunit
VKPFDYRRAADVAGAVSLLAQHHHAAVLAGGTNLVDHMKLGIAAPDVVVDVSRLPFDRIEAREDGGLRIGAGVRNSVLAADRTVRSRYPVLAEALLAGASGQLRNLATTAGNVMQRTRCAYFQDVTTPCNKRQPGTGCSAVDGWTRYHAIFGASPSCIAVHPSDMAVAMAALDATVHVLGPDGERTIAFEDFHRLPGDHPERDTTLARDELIVAVELPALPATTRSRYRKVRDRASYAFALVSVAAVLEVRDGVVADARIALGGVAHKPWRARLAEAAIRHQHVDADVFRRAADLELAAARPLRDNAFKVRMARNLISSVLTDLARQDDR